MNKKKHIVLHISFEYFFLKFAIKFRHIQVKRRVCHSALLKHSCRCQDRTCQIPMCIKMKRVLTHTNMCQGKTAESMVCQEIATFCLNHTIVCTQKDCILSTNRINNWIAERLIDQTNIKTKNLYHLPLCQSFKII